MNDEQHEQHDNPMVPFVPDILLMGAAMPFGEVAVAVAAIAALARRSRTLQHASVQLAMELRDTAMPALLAARATHAMQPQRTRRAPAHPPAPVAPVAPVQADEVAHVAPRTDDEPRARYWSTWTRTAMQSPHLFIVGGTGDGKTTLARALLYIAAREGQVAVIDPHANLNEWGVPAIGEGRDYEAIAHGLEALHAEMQQRYELPRAEAKALPRLTVVIDEVPAITGEIGEQWAATFPRLVREARKVNIVLVVLTQSDRVQALGLKGIGDTRDSMCHIRLGATARGSRGAPPIPDSEKFPATIEIGGREVWIETRQAPVYATYPIPDSALWQPGGVRGVRGSANGTNPFIRLLNGNERATNVRTNDETTALTPAHAANANADIEAYARAAWRVSQATGAGKQEAIRMTAGLSPGGSSRYRAIAAAYDRLAKEKV